MINKVVLKIGKFFSDRIKNYNIKKYAPSVAKELKAIFDSHFTDDIPVILISYNNGVYVENSCKQLANLKCKPIVIDNASTDALSLNTLVELERNGDAYVIRSQENFGHLVGFIDEIYEALPEVFAYSDPDLQFNPDLPSDFLNILAGLTLEYNVYKAGFALPTNIGQRLYDNKVPVYREGPFMYSDSLTIEKWEGRFWRFKLPNESLEIYAATIDTTFAVYRKSNYFGNFEDAIRLAGNYSALHLPWFVDLDLFSEENRARYKNGNVSSTWV